MGGALSSGSGGEAAPAGGAVAGGPPLPRQPPLHQGEPAQPQADAHAFSPRLAMAAATGLLCWAPALAISLLWPLRVPLLPSCSAESNRITGAMRCSAWEVHGAAAQRARIGCKRLHKQHGGFWQSLACIREGCTGYAIGAGLSTAPHPTTTAQLLLPAERLPVPGAEPAAQDRALQSPVSRTRRVLSLQRGFGGQDQSFMKPAAQLSPGSASGQPTQPRCTACPLSWS